MKCAFNCVSWNCLKEIFHSFKMLMKKLETQLTILTILWKLKKQIEKVLISDRLCVSNVSWKFLMPTIYNFAVMDPWILLFS